MFHQRLAECLAISLGASIGYFTGDPLRLLDDVQTLKPHFFPSVPRVLNRVYQGAMLAGDVPNFRGNIFRKAVASKLETLHTTGQNTHAFWDRLVFRKVRVVREGIHISALTLLPGPGCPWWKLAASDFWIGTHQSRCRGLPQDRS